MEHERVPLSIAAARAGPQVPAQGVPGGALLHDPLQHLPDPAGHLHAGLCRAPLPQQLYVGLTQTRYCSVAFSSAILVTASTHSVYGSFTALKVFSVKPELSWTDMLNALPCPNKSPPKATSSEHSQELYLHPKWRRQKAKVPAPQPPPASILPKQLHIPAP